MFRIAILLHNQGCTKCEHRKFTGTARDHRRNFFKGFPEKFLEELLDKSLEKSLEESQRKFLEESYQAFLRNSKKNSIGFHEGFLQKYLQRSVYYKNSSANSRCGSSRNLFPGILSDFFLLIPLRIPLEILLDFSRCLLMDSSRY